MDKLRQFFGGISRKVWIALAFVVAVVAAAIGLDWARGAKPTEQSVEAKWDVALRQLGVEPVYPPEEDIEVGDVFAIVSSDSLPENGVVDSPLANHAIRLWRLDLSDAVNSNYANTYVFPKPVAKRDAAPSSDAPAASNSVFLLTDHPSDLPIVTFPKFRLTDSRAAKLGLVGDVLGGVTGSAAANSDVETEVSITRTQTYGVPYLVAENALVTFCEATFPPACQDQALRNVLSTRIGPRIFDIVENKKTKEKKYRMAVEVGLINRVFLTRQIETHLVRSQNFSGQAALGSSSEPKPGEPSGPAAPAVAGAAQEALKTAGDEALAAASGDVQGSGSLGEQSGLAVSFDGKVLERPVVFGFESARYHPSSATPEANANANQGAAAAK
jgi:hypothetical protein